MLNSWPITNDVSQVGVLKSERPLAFTDPRSPTVGISRTPVREVMRGNYLLKNNFQIDPSDLHNVL